jgi:hypothetical protein
MWMLVVEVGFFLVMWASFASAMPMELATILTVALALAWWFA